VTAIFKATTKRSSDAQTLSVARLTIRPGEPFWNSKKFRAPDSAIPSTWSRSGRSLRASGSGGSGGDEPYPFYKVVDRWLLPPTNSSQEACLSRP